MYIQWCLKGIAESPGFADSDAIALFGSGIKSNWLRQNATLSLDAGLPQGQVALNETALFRHVNDYAAVGAQTPYISLSAGVVQPTAFGYAEFPAWFTAVDFATSGSMHQGFVYRVWTVVSPKPSARLINVSDEIRDLNLFRDFWRYNNEGEIAAKLLVPSAQIQFVAKVDSQPAVLWTRYNPSFVMPESICNLVGEV